VIGFGWPGAWPLLALAPLVGGFLALRLRARRRRLAELAGPRHAQLLAAAGHARRRRRLLLFSLSLFLACLALLQPRWGTVARDEQAPSLDLLVCLDVSRSMLARDLRPSRLERAQQEIRALTEAAPRNRYGLVCFAGDARLSVPLTADLATYAGLVDLAGPASVARGGTDLGAALERALEALDGGVGGAGRPAAVLLLSDGEDLEQRGLELAQRCREAGVVVHCVGFGSTRGSKIALESDGGESFLRGPDGAEVVTALDETGLRALAEATGGVYLGASDEPQPLVALHDRALVPMAGRAAASAGSREPRERYQWPLLAAYLLWILELAWAGRPRR